MIRLLKWQYQSTATAPGAPWGHPYEEVRTIWCSVLGLADAAPGDHFFDFRGHSLRATQFANQVRARLSCDVPVGALFDHPTLEGITGFIACRLEAGDRARGDTVGAGGGMGVGPLPDVDLTKGGGTGVLPDWPSL